MYDIHHKQKCQIKPCVSDIRDDDDDERRGARERGKNWKMLQFDDQKMSRFLFIRSLTMSDKAMERESDEDCGLVTEGDI
jgi:hypothetical protein